MLHIIHFFFLCNYIYGKTKYNFFLFVIIIKILLPLQNHMNIYIQLWTRRSHWANGVGSLICFAISVHYHIVNLLILKYKIFSFFKVFRIILHIKEVIRGSLVWRHSEEMKIMNSTDYYFFLHKFLSCKCMQIWKH